MRLRKALRMSDITVVVSTYNRPRALVSALEGIKWQTLAPAKVLVIGDCCTPETGEVLQSVTGLPLHYINLTTRFGEQAGPNSVGAALTRTRYIAFLNHDDLWLPDHLARAAAVLKQRRADFVTARASFAHTDPDDDDRHLFTEVSPVGRHLSQSFSAPFYLFEPMSAWLMTTAAARRLKRWRPAATLYRAPLIDWVMRAWRAGLRHADTDTVTVLKHNIRRRQPPKSKRLYDSSTAALDDWIAGITADGADGFRERIAANLAEAARRGLGRNFRDPIGQPALVRETPRSLTPFNAARYRWTGYDAMQEACQRAGLDRGWQLRDALHRRTGEALPTPPDLAAVTAWAATQLAQLEAGNRA